jgi:GATA-binding protein
VIKSRNRVKNSGQPSKKKALRPPNPSRRGRALTPYQPSLFDSPTNALGPTSSHPTPRSEAGTPPPGHHYRSVSPQSSRSGTPLPGIFDHALLHHGGADSPPTLPSLATLNQPSPGPYAPQEPLTIDSLIAANNKLKTRVAELELVNDLFRGRVGELENSESNARRAEISRKEAEVHLRQCLDEAAKREEALKRKVEEMEKELAEYRGEAQTRKKVRVSDLTG